ncbi:UNVERIFIED_CONTAM: putative LRR receptor-like serine/threonine-protein kinase [Sesamum latifolium]|uniref:LRR receptor-like serine/threonine-protein kinase n=1 Tax=Sesamum latifolium TaxID=2727402 RepID=A0AAW2UEQ0_9LAMI
MTSSIIVECLVLLIFFYFASSPATCSIYEVDLRALLSFKENIIDPRGALDSWRYNETVSYCTWTGISCGSRHRNRVVSIDLNSQGLAGFVSPHLGNLSFIRGINLQNNSFHGPIPQELGRLRRLEYLVLSNNSFDGEIPKNLSQCQNLYFLNLVDNVLTGNVPFKLSSLMKLEVLILSKNNLSGTIPSFIGNFTFLEKLSLSHNGFHGEIPKSLVHLQNLKFLALEDNMLTGRIPSGLYNISSILVFAVTSNHFQGNIPSDIGFSFPNLQFLGLGKIILLYRQLHKLAATYLEGNSFHGEIPEGLSLLKGLQELDLSRNNFSGVIPSFLGELSLAKLNLSFNKLRGPVPVDGVFRNVSAMLLEGNTELCGGISELKLPLCPPMNPKKKNSHRKTKSRDDLYASPFESQFPRLSYADLLRATDGFSEANMIGLGRFGSVYKGIINDGDITVAVKVLNLHIQGAHKSFTRECNVLRGVRHRNLLKILSISVSTDYQGNEFTSLIYEFKGNGSLDKWLHLDTDGQHENTRYLTLMQRLNIAIDVASALEYLHNGTGSTIIHGDLKPSNILLDDDMTAHVGDFGLSKVISNVSSGLAANESHSVAVKGTIGYIAPEYGMVGTGLGDIYSYGILLLELFTT